ncbi:acyl transferase domain-containing protein/acyl carrier protein/SAM-dependent methyltransferase [Paenibacillus forsythiae]|uniref:Acyl transferase domain-containing protein/acyl carrier protein/SAM-dependent methyltransferase n=1 Tax=Paenibacillus forsythiae TaxID=365616 RepID=A0ABU3HEF2_9BACL|nr:SDR family NAD(P)-dependent oxidoreductase [Paenibacillus forsythiae]MDT3429207.1 acyl transferase domain-containing protein/acyl carrier protein/SAM-dependent methyltransferase [Paenibacillus forsythiae]
MQEMEDLLCKLMWGQLQSMGIYADDHSALAALKGKSALYDRWLKESIAVLGRKQYVCSENGIITAGRNNRININEVWREWRRKREEWSKDASIKARVDLAEATVRALPEILSGKVRATDIIFPNSSMDLVEGIYKDNPVADFYNELLANTLLVYVQEIVERQPDARVRILEIGAGTGGTSSMVLRKLKPYRHYISEYLYTDISQAFLRRAEQKLGPDNPFLVCRLLDVEKPLQRQGLEEGGYDVVIAANVLHATKNIHLTLRNAKSALKKNGILLLNEISENTLFAHITFGLLEGWWLYEDPEIRIPGCPILSPDAWKTALRAEGFASVFFPALHSHHMGQQIIVAESDGIIRIHQSQMNITMPESTAEEATGHDADMPERRFASYIDRSPSRKMSGRRPKYDASDQMIKEYIQDAVIDRLSESLKLENRRIHPDESFSDYGLDSITGVQLVRMLNESLRTELPTSCLFDYSSVNRLSEYIFTVYKDTIAKELRISPKGKEDLDTVTGEEAVQTAQPAKALHRINKRSATAFRTVRQEGFVREPIAIVGMSGRFGKADSVDELWEHLARGDDLVEEVTRWDFTKYPFEDGSYCRHGSFISDIACFDPLFFNISGTEAAYMDPQQRLFLEESWKALEDAGYAGAGLDGSQCGVYVGYNIGDYAELIGNRSPAQAMWGNAGSVIPARIAYYLNLKGPAITVDTACSSSLTAVHLACQSLWTGEIGMALAGGVFIQSTPGFYLSAGKAGMLSPTGRCHTFDERADGFVPGEGVGAVILKRLSDAQADGDFIYGVIRGSGLNQDGSTNGITAPSAKSQESLIRRVYDTFHIQPEEIQMVEAHGTGTKLGDPIEYQALTEAFRNYTNRREYCAVGSIKTNIGHVTAAAGVASTIKVLLSMKHKQMPPSLHFRTGNPDIAFKGSPFYVNTELKHWDMGPDGKRRAAISAFGFSGTNAHIVIEEAPLNERVHQVKPGYLLVLSARTEEQLRQQVVKLIDYCKVNTAADCGNMSYTLLLGRKHFLHRLAFVARDRDEVLILLQKWLDKGKTLQVYHAHLQEGDHREQLSLRQFGNECIANCREEQEASRYLEHLTTVAELYVQGYMLEFDQLFADDQYTRVPLPTYPFGKDRYWVPEQEKTALESGSQNGEAAPGSFIHPLLQRNTSDLEKHKFTSAFSGQEFFLSDHIVAGQRMLPGVAYLEMARKAVEQSAGSKYEGYGVRLRNIVWARPITVEEEPVEVHIGLSRDPDGSILYEIYSRNGGNEADQTVIHSQGRARYTAPSTSINRNIAAIRNRCGPHPLSREECYRLFLAAGIEYGPGFRGIEELHAGSGEVLVRLSLPSAAAHSQDDYILHPSIMDSALQAMAGLSLNIDGSQPTGALTQLKPAVPFAMEELEIFKPCTPSMWAYIRYSDGYGADSPVQKMDIDLCGVDGQVYIRISGFSTRLLERQEKLPGEEQPTKAGLLLLEPEWKEQREVSQVPEETYFHHVVIFLDLEKESAERLKALQYGTRCHVLQATGEIAERYENCILDVSEEIRTLLADGTPGNSLIQLVAMGQDRALFSGLAGMFKTVRLENRQVTGQFIELEADGDEEYVIRKLDECKKTPYEAHIRYSGGKRWVPRWVNPDVSPGIEILPWKDHGVYLITGGMGGLGYLFAKEIARRTVLPTLILAGRSPLDDEQQTKLEELEHMGARAAYWRADIASRTESVHLIGRIEADFGKLDGVIHSAGIIHDNLLRHKSSEEMSNVLEPKVKGLVHLDQATKHLSLDFFVFFSAASGVFGNVGQADYSAANGFMDAYADYRHQLVESNQRNGRTLSLIWPLWREGGMRVDRRTEQLVRERLGMTPMETESGIKALYRAYALNSRKTLVLAGDEDKLLYSLQPETAMPLEETSAAVQIAPDSLRTQTLQLLSKILAEAINIPLREISSDTSFSKYGLDSIMQIDLIRKLEGTTGELSKTLLFEYANIGELADYLVTHYGEQLSGSFLAEKPTLAQPLLSSGLEQIEARFIEKDSEPIRKKSANNMSEDQANGPIMLIPEKHAAADIAIIGISGRYPASDNLEELWQHLKSGHSCVSEVPLGRWKQSFIRSLTEIEELQQAGKRRFGGFLKDIDGFDYQLFEMGEQEAAELPPELRLFLETVWETVHDAGYSIQALQEQQARNGSGVGVFVGSMYSQHPWTAPVAEQALKKSNRTDWQIANRASYFFNLTGPSLTVNTACSSSLTAIHLACESLKQKSCSMAVAGGVNLTLDPSKYESLEDIHFLEDGELSRSFGAGDGYIPGEGVGAVLLKPLASALEDGDRIYCVIKSSFINHSGGRQKYSVPDPKQQMQLIAESIRRSGIDPETITYVESAANGSKLGDPIEVGALHQAFSQFTGKKQYCALGSVKSNLGHLEAASGISQLSKVILQMQHRTLVPTINANPRNPNLMLEHSAFFLQEESTEWVRVNDPTTGAILPLRSMINSFGAGGAYANVIIEEYLPEPPVDRPDFARDEECLLVFSAKTEFSLKRYLKRFSAFLEEHGDVALKDIALLLYKSNPNLEHRTAVIASSVKELQDTLRVLAQRPEERSDLDGISKTMVGREMSGDIGEREILRAFSERNVRRLAQAWLAGADLDFRKLDGRNSPCRISLPAYAFDRGMDDSPRAIAENAIKGAFREEFYRTLLERLSKGEITKEKALLEAKKYGDLGGQYERQTL